MLAYTYVSKGKFSLLEKPKPELLEEKDAIVKVELASICTSDLHIRHGAVPRAVPGITVGHEMVGIVEAVGAGVMKVKPGDRHHYISYKPDCWPMHSAQQPDTVLRENSPQSYHPVFLPSPNGIYDHDRQWQSLAMLSHHYSLSHHLYDQKKG